MLVRLSMWLHTLTCTANIHHPLSSPGPLPHGMPNLYVLDLTLFTGKPSAVANARKRMYAPGDHAARQQILRRVLLDGADWEPTSGALLDVFVQSVAVPRPKRKHRLSGNDFDLRHQNLWRGSNRLGNCSTPKKRPCTVHWLLAPTTSPWTDPTQPSPRRSCVGISRHPPSTRSSG